MHAARIPPYRKSNPPNGDIEDSVMNVGQIDKEASKEEKEGEMQQGGQRFNRPGKVQLLDTLSNECTNPRSPVWTVPWRLCNADITTGPLVQPRSPGGHM